MPVHLTINDKYKSQINLGKTNYLIHADTGPIEISIDKPEGLNVASFYVNFDFGEIINPDNAYKEANNGLTE